MKLVDVSCPHCGAGLTITDNAKTVHCEYCNHDFIIDDEVIHVAHRIADAEQLGYDMEAGRYRFRKEAEAREGRMTAVTCPLCGYAFFADSAEKTVNCLHCKKEMNVQQAIAFGKAVGYENRSENIGDLEDAMKWYDEALKYDPNNETVLEARNELKSRLTNRYIIVAILIIAIVAFFLRISTFVGVGLIAILLICLALMKAGSENDSNVEESLKETTPAKSDDSGMNNEFPPPDFDDPGMIPDPHTCMAKVEENEELADRARTSGRNDLAEQYESVAAHWRYLYEEAEDEEMEW